MAATSAARCVSATATSLALSRARPFCLFAAWLRSSSHRMVIPVGTCLIRTAVSTLFTFCPPAPPLRMVLISRSESFSNTVSTAPSSSTGVTSTAANDVCRVASFLNGDCRTSLCVPRSQRKYPYANRPSTSNVTLFNPASSPSLRSTVFIANPRPSHQPRYMRSNISAQSCASVPPAPA